MSAPHNTAHLMGEVRQAVKTQHNPSTVTIENDHMLLRAFSALQDVLDTHSPTDCEVCGQQPPVTGDELHDCEHYCSECMDDHPCEQVQAICRILGLDEGE